jgi:hypothetical protein
MNKYENMNGSSCVIICEMITVRYNIITIYYRKIQKMKVKLQKENVCLKILHQSSSDPDTNPASALL